MAWNLNNKKQDYALSKTVTNEFIDMYGLIVRYFSTELIHEDNILNEFQHVKIDNTNAFDISVYPEDTAGFQNNDDILSKFGFMSSTSTNFFISAKTVDFIMDSQKEITQMIGGVIKTPSGKLLEITNIDIEVPGINNMFLYNNQKNVFMLKTKPFIYNSDEIDNETKLEMEFDDDISYPKPNGDLVPDMSYVFGIAETADLTKSKVKEESTIPIGYDPVFGNL